MSWATVASNPGVAAATKQEIIVRHNTGTIAKPKSEQSKPKKHLPDGYVMMNDGKKKNKFQRGDYTRCGRNSRQCNAFELEILVHGYMNRLRQLSSRPMPTEIQEMVCLYCWRIGSASRNAIAATHLIASIIDEFMKRPEHRCECMPPDEMQDGVALDLLQYIFIRGGACRDSLLLREINDVDLVVNSHELAQQYLLHLSRYHATAEHQADSVRCFLWQHYLNRFKKSARATHRTPGNHNSKTVDKLVQFESLLVHSNYVLNSKFVCDIIERSDRLKPHEREVSIRYFGHHHHMVLQDGVQHIGILIKRIEFDVVDQLVKHCYGSEQSLENYKMAQGDDAVKAAVRHIDEYYAKEAAEKQKHKKSEAKAKRILFPMYPFPTTFMYYDYTINCVHLDLRNVLLRNERHGQLFDQQQQEVVEFDWSYKIREKTFNYDLVNKYNIIGINHNRQKVLVPPNAKVLSKCSAMFYFWRLLKTAQKFIYEIKRKEWTLDKHHLQQTIGLYHSWFDADFVNGSASQKFISKLLKWDIKGAADYIDRLHVLRLIRFEQYLISKLKKYDKFKLRFEQELKAEIARFSSEKRMMIIKCWKDFGYPLHV